MRRKDRQMNIEFAYKAIDKAPYATLSTTDIEGNPYGIPISVVREENILYFHCALDGKKLDNINSNKNVVISAVTRCKPRPIDFTVEYESAVIYGKALEVKEDKEKIHALRLICERYAMSNIDEFQNAIDKSLFRTNVVKIEIKEATGKRKEYNKDGKEIKSNI